jgi:hypothetical protein
MIHPLINPLNQNYHHPPVAGKGGRTPLMEAAGGGYKDIVHRGMFQQTQGGAP